MICWVGQPAKYLIKNGYKLILQHNKIIKSYLNSKGDGMKVLEIFIAISLFNILLYYYLKNRREKQDYYCELAEMEYPESGDEEEKLI